MNRFQPVSARSRNFENFLTQVSTNDLFHIFRDVLSFLAQKNPANHGTIVTWAASVLGSDNGLMKYRETLRDLVQEVAFDQPFSATSKKLGCQQRGTGKAYGYSTWFSDYYDDRRRPREENSLTVGDANAAHLANELLYRISQFADTFHPTCDFDLTIADLFNEMKIYFTALYNEAVEQVKDYASHRDKNVAFREQTANRVYNTPHKKHEAVTSAPPASKARVPKQPAGNLAPKKLNFEHEPVDDAAEDAKPKPAAKPQPVTTIPVPDTRPVSSTISYSSILKKKNEDAAEKTLAPPPATPEAKSPREVEPAKPVEAVKPAEPVEPAKAVKAVESVDAIEPVESVELTLSKKAQKRRAQKARKAAAKETAMQEVTSEPATEAVELKPIDVSNLVKIQRGIVGENNALITQEIWISREDYAKLQKAPGSPSK